MAKGQNGLQVKSITDLVLVKKGMLHSVKDVRAVKGIERSLSDDLFLCVESC